MHWGVAYSVLGVSNAAHVMWMTQLVILCMQDNQVHAFILNVETHRRASRGVRKVHITMVAGQLTAG